MVGALRHALEDSYAAGLALAARGLHADAIAKFDDALRTRPHDPKILFAIGNTARAIGQTALAEAFFRRVLAAAPRQVEALVQLANLLRETGRPQDAIALLQPAISEAQEIPELWLTLGSAVREAGDVERAAIFYREALRLRPNFPQALGNLADLLADDGELLAAIATYDQVIKAAPHDSQARLNRAILHLARGDLARGWRDYEHRLKIGKALTHGHGLPTWNGKWRRGLKLLVTAEQGIGDQIAFASMLPDLMANAENHGAALAMDAEPRLVPLFARSFPSIAVHPSRTERLGAAIFAHHDWLQRGQAHAAIPIGSLAAQYRADISDFPPRARYLRADESETARWRGYFSAHGTGPFIGLCWRSGNVLGLRAQQYAPLEAWAAFAQEAPGTLVSLQYDVRSEEIDALERLSGRKILVPPALDQKHELDRTAAMIACLDAVVSAPTAVSWISAAVGVPTFKILYHNSWMSFGTDHEPFAPSCRAVMPGRRGDWHDCFAQVQAALAHTKTAAQAAVPSFKFENV